jgi:transcription-repair coupling factor (superfamily II helicase)
MTVTAPHPRPTHSFAPPLPEAAGEPVRWGRLYGSGAGLALASACARRDGLVVVVAASTQEALRLEAELRFFAGPQIPTLLQFPDWETLPYDVFSPYQDIVSERLATLYTLPRTPRGALIVPVGTLMHRLPPRGFIEQHALSLETGQRLNLDAFRRDLEASGYRAVGQVMEHGEFAVRGSLIDLFPMGSREPFRVDLLDDEIETLRSFDPETQLSCGPLERIRLLPARETPLDPDAIAGFRQRYRQLFEGDPRRSLIYREVSEGNPPPGIEYYLPLFFDQTATLFDYLPAGSLLVRSPEAERESRAYWTQVQERFELRRHDPERPLLPPELIAVTPDQLETSLSQLPLIELERFEQQPAQTPHYNFPLTSAPSVQIQPRAENPAQALLAYLNDSSERVLFLAESGGRREYLLELLSHYGVRPRGFDSWPDFLNANDMLGVTVSPVEEGLRIEHPAVVILTEQQLFGERAQQQRRRRRSARDPDAIIRNLTDLSQGAPVVHEEHGVGRYLGLTSMEVGGIETEFLTLEYADKDRLYVPVSSIHLISRYTGASPENAPLHKLGGEQWQRIKRKAAERAWDVAAELLDIHARRAARVGHRFTVHTDDYDLFTAGFPFEETPDQEAAIEAVLEDLASPRPTDRVVCGDVGFGKTEVAMRAAFVAAQDGQQVAVLVPTTLLARQHFENFRDRFADWPIRIEMLSRFGTKGEHRKTLEAIANGRVDIVIGTHRLLQADVKFKNLGLVIIDEEHRFGVRDKERLKALRAQVDLLTLTATPIPRTLNMSLAGLRDLSLIATAPAQRHAIKTFVSDWSTALVQEGCMREFKRGGQVYFLHNEVKTIERIAIELGKLLPQARIGIAHGQMRERELERVMLDFYHQRINLLVCTTIIESGIDVPSANTIFINRADKFGVAQLHQLRGRVGRSHHRAYAYLITPPKTALTADALKRLEAIESLEELGVGFTLATHDLEIRGAGELLGEDQSGQIQEIGFALYTELLERAVRSLKAGEAPDIDRPLHAGTEIDLQAPALLPESYVPDVHSRLILYKRISAASTMEDLRELQVELIDRFGLLPEPVKNLFAVMVLKLETGNLGVKKIEVGPHGGRLVFTQHPNIEPAALVHLIQRSPDIYRFDGRQTLRFVEELPDTESRIAAVTELSERLSSVGPTA